MQAIPCKAEGWPLSSPEGQCDGGDPKSYAHSSSQRRPFSSLDLGWLPTSHLEEQLVLCYSLNGLDEEVTKGQPLIDLLFNLLESKGKGGEWLVSKIPIKSSKSSHYNCLLCCSCLSYASHSPPPPPQKALLGSRVFTVGTVQPPSFTLVLGKKLKPVLCSLYHSRKESGKGSPRHNRPIRLDAEFCSLSIQGFFLRGPGEG